MNLIDMISDEDKTLIDEYRNAYAADDDYSYVSSGNTMCSTDYFLRFWDGAKASLYKLLGNNISISKEVSFTPAIHELKTIASDNPNYRPYWSFLSQFRSFTSTLEHNNIIQFEPYSAYYNIYGTLLTDKALYTNRTNAPLEFYYFDANNEKKHFIANANSKTSKIIGKICNIFNIEGYEQFRILHSQLLNTSKIKGELVLSIHPMDFMTMSDNACDWSSCMSWMDNGCYRMGTIEMMNSPCVIVAYIKAKDPMTFYGYEWNSKKWRSLFIVTPEIITNVKGYPYALPALEEEIVGMLKELAEKNCSWDYYDVQRMNKDCHFTFTTDMMYNDINSDSSLERFCAVGNTLNEGQHIFIHYSGRTECAWCGGTHFDRSDEDIEGSLLCDECAPNSSVGYCYCCDADIYEGDEYYIIDDEYVCADCYIDCVAFDPIDKEEHLINNMAKIYILPSEARELSKEQLSTLFIEDSEGLSAFYTCRRYDVDPEWITSDNESFIHMAETGFLRTAYYIFADEFTDKGRTAMIETDLYNPITHKFTCEDLNILRSIRFYSESMEKIIELMTNKEAS